MTTATTATTTAAAVRSRRPVGALPALYTVEALVRWAENFSPSTQVCRTWDATGNVLAQYLRSLGYEIVSVACQTRLVDERGEPYKTPTPWPPFDVLVALEEQLPHGTTVSAGEVLFTARRVRARYARMRQLSERILADS